MSPIERREFLRYSSGLAALGAGGPFALELAGIGAASAATLPDYRALVCVFLYGGNDAYNTVLATDPSSWAVYQALRNQAPSSIALRNDGSGAAVLPIAPARSQGRSFALHPQLPQLRSLFAAQKVAIVAGVGPLVVPMTKADLTNDAVPKPPKLCSHSDQSAYWQAMAPEGAQTGWGGRIADLLMNRNQGLQTFTAISPTGRSVWLAGRGVRQYDVATTGAIALGRQGTLFGSTDTYAAATAIMSHTDGSHVMQDDVADVFTRSVQASTILNGALAPLATAQEADPALRYRDPGDGRLTLNPLAQQLQVIARIARQQATLGMRRQIFFVGMSTFDTHGDQLRQHAKMLAQLDHGLGYFWGQLGAAGLQNAVTTFTASDFGRTFTSNGDGTDHGWGGHHFVMGGAVKGGDIYGSFPTYGLPDAQQRFASPDQLFAGVMLPRISVDQYAATLGTWMGASAGDLGLVLPNLRNFGQRDLGFMSA